LSSQLRLSPVVRCGTPGWRTRRHTALSLVLLIAFLPSCYRWHEEGPTPRAALQGASRHTVYLTRSGGSTVVLRNAVVVGDSIVGKREGVRTRDPRPRVVIPLAEVVRVRTRRGLNAGKTAGVLAGLAAAAVLVTVVVYGITYEDQS